MTLLYRDLNALRKLHTIINSYKEIDIKNMKRIPNKMYSFVFVFMFLSLRCNSTSSI